MDKNTRWSLRKFPVGKSQHRPLSSKVLEQGLCPSSVEDEALRSPRGVVQTVSQNFPGAVKG